MASTIRLELVTPERLLLSEEVDEVVLPGYEGEFGVLPEHTQFLAILNGGVLRGKSGGGTRNGRRRRSAGCARRGSGCGGRRGIIPGQRNTAFTFGFPP